MLTFSRFHRYYHHGFDKPDNVDEIGQPIPDDLFNNRCADDDECTLVEDTCEAPDFLHPEMFETKRCCSLDDDETAKQPTPPAMIDEGTQTVVVVETLPQVVEKTPVSPKPTRPRSHVSPPNLHLNIFDQSSILKLITTRNWTETFFNRVLRKKLLSVELEQQLLHMTATQDFQLPAIVSRDGMEVTLIIMKETI